MNQLNKIKESIEQAIPNSEVSIEDMGGTGDHLQVNVVSSAFENLSLIQQHQLVYGALQREFASETIHALALNTSHPK
tara:strand:+ start:208 stop:441 length:234 start_codon:yes stop_codon:yes gene_type:complete